MSAPTPDLTKVRVLVVDDNRYMLAIVKTILQGFGVMEVTEIRASEAAFPAFNETAPDIVIVDYVMEPLDGIAVTRLIRLSPESKNPYVPIIMLSAFAQPAQVWAARDAGVNEFLVKPVVPGDLYKKLVSVIYHPRPFVRTQHYFGPDRRRHKKSDFQGSDRRKQQLTLVRVTKDGQRKSVSSPAQALPA